MFYSFVLFCFGVDDYCLKDSFPLTFPYVSLHMWQCPWNPKEGIRFPGTGVTISLSSHVSAKNQTQVLSLQPQPVLLTTQPPPPKAWFHWHWLQIQQILYLVFIYSSSLFSAPWMSSCVEKLDRDVSDSSLPCPFVSCAEHVCLSCTQRAPLLAAFAKHCSRSELRTQKHFHTKTAVR